MVDGIHLHFQQQRKKVILPTIFMNHFHQNSLKKDLLQVNLSKKIQIQIRLFNRVNFSMVNLLDNGYNMIKMGIRKYSNMNLIALVHFVEMDQRVVLLEEEHVPGMVV